MASMLGPPSRDRSFESSSLQRRVRESTVPLEAKSRNTLARARLPQPVSVPPRTVAAAIGVQLRDTVDPMRADDGERTRPRPRPLLSSISETLLEGSGSTRPLRLAVSRSRALIAEMISKWRVMRRSKNRLDPRARRPQP
jgi:hypothetical protein